MLAGCYERVVRAEGPANRSVTTYEPNLKESESPVVRGIEEVLFGPQPTSESRRAKRGNR